MRHVDDPHHPEEFLMRDMIRQVEHPEMARVEPEMVQPTIKVSRDKVAEIAPAKGGSTERVALGAPHPTTHCDRNEKNVTCLCQVRAESATSFGETRSSDASMPTDKRSGPVGRLAAR